MEPKALHSKPVIPKPGHPGSRGQDELASDADLPDSDLLDPADFAEALDSPGTFGLSPLESDPLESDPLESEPFASELLESDPFASEFLESEPLESEADESPEDSDLAAAAPALASRLSLR